MDNKDMETCSDSLVIREMKLKPYYTTTRMGETVNTKCW